jgi:hypothetical protein
MIYDAYTVQTNKYECEIPIYNKRYLFKIADTQGFSNNEIIGWSRFNQYKEYKYFMVMFILSDPESIQTCKKALKILK